MIFAASSTEGSTASMIVADDEGNQYTFYSRPSDLPPFIYFIPDGEYTIVALKNISSCSTAIGTLKVGDTFSGKTVGYISAEIKDGANSSIPERPKVFQSVVGNDATSVPGDCQKVVFVLQSSLPVSGTMIVQDTNGTQWQLSSRWASDHLPIFYFIKKGTYKILSMSYISTCNTNAGVLGVGDTFYVGVAGQKDVGYFVMNYKNSN